MIIYFERIYSIIFFFFEIIMFIFKANILVYPPGNLGTEIVGLFFLSMIQYVKLANANTANKTELRNYHIYTMLFSIPSLMGYLFYLRFQVYCLVFDVVISAIGMAFAFFGLLFSIFACVKIKYKEQ